MSTAVHETTQGATEFRVCSLDELPEGIGRAFVVGTRSIAIFRTRCGALHAVENKCPHRGGPLSDGIVVSDQIVCPLHAWRFNLRSGQCQENPNCLIQRFCVRTEHGQVLLKLKPPVE